MAVALLAGLGWPGWGRILAAAALQFLWRRGRDWLTYPGRGATRRLIWDRNGIWWLQDPGRAALALRLTAPPHQLGPLLWFPFRSAAGRELTLIDASFAEPVGLCRLKRALKVDSIGLDSEETNA